MNLAIEILGYGGIVPATISIAVLFFARRFKTSSVCNRYAAAVAFALAFFVGCALLPSWSPFWPQRHWQWLPYLAAIAMVVGPVGLASGVCPRERWLLHLLLAIIAAWLLVPAWASLQPHRVAYVATLPVGLFLLSVLLDPLPARMSRPLSSLSSSVPSP